MAILSPSLLCPGSVVGTKPCVQKRESFLEECGRSAVQSATAVRIPRNSPNQHDLCSSTSVIRNSSEICLVPAQTLGASLMTLLGLG